MSVQGLEVNMAASSGAQAGGGEEGTPPALDTTGVAERPSLYIYRIAGNIGGQKIWRFGLQNAM